MKAIKFGVLLSVTVLATACTVVTGGGDAGEALSIEECRSYWQHTYSLDGMDIQAMLGEEGLAKEAQLCSEGSVTRRHYDCAMQADSVEALQSCGAPNT